MSGTSESSCAVDQMAQPSTMATRTPARAPAAIDTTATRTISPRQNRTLFIAASLPDRPAARPLPAGAWLCRIVTKAQARRRPGTCRQGTARSDRKRKRPATAMRCGPCSVKRDILFPAARFWAFPCHGRTWRRPTLPRLKTKYHRRRGISRPSSGWDRVQRPRYDHQVGA